MKSKLQDDLERLASLGKPISEFGVNGHVLVSRLVWSMVLVVLGIALDGLLMAGNHGIESLTLGLMFVMLGVMLAIRSYRNLGLRVLVYPEGGILFRGDRAATFFWDEIVRLWKKPIELHLSIWKGSLILRLEKTDGESIEIDDALPYLRELARIIEEKTFPLLFSSAICTLEAGRCVHFRVLVVHPSGLEARKGTLPWEELKEIKWENDGLAIYKKGKWRNWYTLKLSHIPNYHVIVPLIGQMLKSKSHVERGKR
jgi:hypothetical protein